MNLELARGLFFEETDEQLAAMETALLAIEASGGAPEHETLNALFRAAHTIKGSAGLFNFADIVGFTHLVESILERLREGEIAVSRELVQLLLTCRDHIRDMCEQIQRGEPVQVAPELDQKLFHYLSVTAPEPEKPANTKAARPISAGDGSPYWHISLRFHPDILRMGMDPSSLLRYLCTMGRIVALTTLYESLPAAEHMDPEACYLGFELEFESDADQSAIEGVFDFVRDDSQIHVVAPNAGIAEYAKLATLIPEGAARLGEILCQHGVITEVDLPALRGEQTPPPATSAEIVAETSEESTQERQRPPTPHKHQHRALRVDAQRLDRLIDLVGELVIAGASAQLVAAGTANNLMIEAISTLSGLVEEIRDEALSLRMVPIGDIFSRFPRLVRDAAQELGKSISLSIEGEATELDKSMVERLADPLTHLLRNAIDHGIEAPAQREAAGKHPEGVVWLNAFHESGSVVVEVGDDGGGIRRDKVRNRAIQCGLLAPHTVLSDAETLQLIFEPGFSTADAVSNLSGRGVGMDVVKRNIESLKGEIDIDSVVGEGTVIRLRVPLTLAIIDGFLIQIGRSQFVIPLDLVVECLDLPPEAQNSSTRCLSLRGELLPFIRLREIFELDSPPAARETVVVVQYGTERAGLVADTLHGELQAVIKPLGQLFRGSKGLAGSTILGSGAVALILDVPALIHRAVSANGQRGVGVQQRVNLAPPWGNPVATSLNREDA